jgi:hypothetical protein
MTGILELSILIPFVLWSINEAQKGRRHNDLQDRNIAELHHCVDKVAMSLQHHVNTSELRIASMADVVDKIWNKVE